MKNLKVFVATLIALTLVVGAFPVQAAQVDLSTKWKVSWSKDYKVGKQTRRDRKKVYTRTYSDGHQQKKTEKKVYQITKNGKKLLSTSKGKWKTTKKATGKKVVNDIYTSLPESADYKFVRKAVKDSLLKKPYSKTTKGYFVAVLYSAYGEKIKVAKAADDPKRARDITSNASYEKAMKWAVETGIVKLQTKKFDETYTDVYFGRDELTTPTWEVETMQKLESLMTGKAGVSWSGVPNDKFARRCHSVQRIRRFMDRTGMNPAKSDFFGVATASR